MLAPPAAPQPHPALAPAGCRDGAVKQGGNTRGHELPVPPVSSSLGFIPHSTRQGGAP